MTASQNQVMPATRPHGGYKGTHQHPPSRYSFNKTSEYQQQLQEDLEKLLQEEQHDNTGSPSWAIEATKIVNHAGKSQLFNKRLLAASKIERHLESVGYGNDQSRRPSASSHRSRPPSSASQSSRPASHTHYKPNSTHQYLTDTMLYDESDEDVNFRLGRPTRTTLLRARQRCGSAPVNSYSNYKEESQKVAKRSSPRNQLSTGLRTKLGSVSDGQSIHSFLTGARYNRAHYFDAKCVTEHGLYMPRSNPHAAFLMRPSSAGTRDDENSPRTSPDDSEDALNASNGHQNSTSKNTKLSQKNHINSQDIDEEPRNMAINRPKSSKLLSRPKSAAVMERKPCATNTISISMKEQAIPVHKAKIGNASVKSVFHPKVKPSPKYFNGVRIQGQSICNNGSVVSPTTIQRQHSADPQSMQRPKSGKVRKTGVTVKDLSHHLQKENIILGNPKTLTDSNGMTFEPNTTLEEIDQYPWESQHSDTSHDHRLDHLDQRSCPSPVETPYDDTSEDDKILNSEPQDCTIPTLKSSLQRVGSAKLKNIHVHFAEDIRENYTKIAQITQNMESENTNSSAVFYVRGNSEVSTDFDSAGKHFQSQKFEFASIDNIEDTISPGTAFGDELYLELDHPEAVESDESSSPVSRVAMSPELNSEHETGKGYRKRMMAPRGTVKSLLNDEEQMELQPFDETVGQENEDNGIRENGIEMDTLKSDKDKQI